MIFIDRPITAQHIRDACARFNEGLRVEYKGTFDANVRSDLAKIVSSFANSQGGVLILGIKTAKGVPQPPFEGFEAAPREEFPLTIENICLQNIHPPLLPRIEVVPSDIAGRTFVVIEVDESGEAPHAIENSKKVYVRTGNAANPYDLAEVDLIIELLKRRREPAERYERLLSAARRRSQPTVTTDRTFVWVDICPTFPRRPLSSAREVWEHMQKAQFSNASLIYPNSLRRVPDGVASLFRQQGDGGRPRMPSQYVELNRFGLAFAARQVSVVPWAGGGEFGTPDLREQLYFADVIQPLLRLTILADKYYEAHGYRGSLMVQVSMEHVRLQAMRFIPASPPFPDDPEDFRCYAQSVSAQRMVTVDRLRVQRIEELTNILAELTWPFWQSNDVHPVRALRVNVESMMHALGA